MPPSGSTQAGQSSGSELKGSNSNNSSLSVLGTCKGMCCEGTSSPRLQPLPAQRGGEGWLQRAGRGMHAGMDGESGPSETEK